MRLLVVLFIGILVAKLEIYWGDAAFIQYAILTAP